MMMVDLFSAHVCGQGESCARARRGSVKTSSTNAERANVDLSNGGAIPAKVVPPPPAITD
jgi:hypothetical protein